MITETAIEVFEGDGGTVTKETEVKFTKAASSPPQTQPIDWESLRNDFPILHQKVHGQARAPYRNNFILNWPSGPHAWPHPARTGPSNEANFFPVFVRGQTGNLEELQWMKV
jgi:hypothetical protein